MEVIRARGLVGKQGNKNTPGTPHTRRSPHTPSVRSTDVCVCVCVAPYVKVYLMDNGKCVLKRRTRLARKTLDPLYQQQLQFEENPEGKVLQVTHTHTHTQVIGVMSLVCVRRSLCGVIMDEWITNPSWGLLRFYWTIWTCPTW